MEPDPIRLCRAQSGRSRCGTGHVPRVGTIDGNARAIRVPSARRSPARGSAKVFAGDGGSHPQVDQRLSGASARPLRRRPRPFGIAPGSWTEAEPILRKAIGDAGQNSERLALLARVARRTGAVAIADSASNESLQGLSADSNSETRGQVAVALADAARISEAIALLEGSKIATSLEGAPCSEDFARARGLLELEEASKSREAHVELQFGRRRGHDGEPGLGRGTGRSADCHPPHRLSRDEHPRGDHRRGGSGALRHRTTRGRSAPRRPAMGEIRRESACHR